MKNIFLFIFIFISSGFYNLSEKTFTDSRDGKIYTYKEIGGLKWMTQNMAYNPGIGTYLYDNSSDNLAKYGYLYNFEAAQKVCPQGWHLPSKTEWQTIKDHVAKYQKAGWDEFNPTLGGYMTDKNAFGYKDYVGQYWTSELDENDAWAVDFSNAPSFFYRFYKYAISVRCVCEAEKEVAPTIEQGNNNKNDEPVFTIVETKPQFPGGITALTSYLQNNIQYPETAKKDGIEGKVYIEFVVTKNGEISDVKTLRSSNNIDLDNEALRVVKSMPNWIPGSQKGQNVNVRYVLPINFSLN